MGMAATTQTEKQVSLKLVVNKETNKVIFAEANNYFVDILFSFLTLPLGTIARLVRKESTMGPVTIGCLNSLYQSVSDLDKECFWNEKFKETLLQPNNSSEDYCSNLKLNIDDTQLPKYFTCSRLDTCGFRCVSTSPDLSCICGSPLTRSLLLKHFSKGFVNHVVTFVITDDLIVMPNSMDYTTSFSLLKNSRINSMSSIKEMTVNVTKEKVLDLLKCALLSNSVLTDLFIGNKPSLERSKFVTCDFENTASIQIKLKLFMRITDDKILFAQGEEDFADLILSFLTFPLGGIVSKFGGKCSLDSIDRLYKSAADLDEKRYFMSKEAKNRVVDPHLALAPQFKFSKQLLPIQKQCPPFYFHYFRDNYKESIIHNEFYMNHDKTNKCKKMSLVIPESPYLTHDLIKQYSSSRISVCVKGPRTFVVTDNLIVAPSSPISVLHLINHLGTPFKDLQEKIITFGVKECLSILKASLNSTSALTYGLRHLFTEVKKEY